MHIADGVLGPEVITLTTAVAVGAVAVSAARIRRLGISRARTVATLGAASAALFVASAVPLPAWPGTSAHVLGTPLAALVLGPAPVAVISGVVVFLQSLIGHGGMTAWGAGTLSMGVAGPVVAWLTYRLIRRAEGSRFIAGSVASALACAATYLSTAALLAWSLADSPAGAPAMFLAVVMSYLPAEIPMILTESVLSGVVMTRLADVSLVASWAPWRACAVQELEGE